jgi:hypothetical protein
MSHSLDFSTYSIRTQVYLNPQSGVYDTILAVDRMPLEMTPLRDMVRMLNMVPLSPYHVGISNPCLRRGVYALTMPSNAHLFDQCSHESPYMGVSDLPVLLTMLSRWGYRVDTRMNSIISRVSPLPICGQLMNGDGIVCYISIGDRGSLLNP